VSTATRLVGSLQARKTSLIEQGMDGTVGRNFDPRKSANQTLTNLSSAPGGALVLQVQDVVLYLER
jgi:hypothetical protein